ncbi:MAG: hypothetical protein ACI9C4_001430 [Paraglaciecola sp.]|jgi:hypothetical protein
MQAKLTTYILMVILFASQSFAFATTDCRQHATTVVSELWADVTKSDSQHPLSSSIDMHRLHQSADLLALSGDIQSMNMLCCDDNCSCPTEACHFFGPISECYYLPSKFSADKLFCVLLAFTTPFVPSVKRPPIIS